MNKPAAFRWVNLLLLAGTMLLILLMWEGALRLWEWRENRFSASDEESGLPALDRQLEELILGKGISAETFNIYYLGGSTMLGEPYEPQMSIPLIVTYLLNGAVAGREIRAINLADYGQDLQVNLLKLQRILARRDVFQPSLCVIYSGHNEFLKFHGQFALSNLSLRLPYGNQIIENSRVANFIAWRLMRYRLELRERKFFDEPLMAEKRYRGVIHQYQDRLGRAVQLLRENGVPLIVSTVAGNYAEWQPNRSIYPGSRQQKLLFRDLMARARSASDRGDFRGAIRLYQEAGAIASRFAELQYCLGKVYQAGGEADSAWAAFSRAVDYDGMPIRTTHAQNEFIRNLSAQTGMSVVDAVEYLRDHAQNRLIGYNLMIDGHHPNERGYLLISQLIAQKIREMFETPSLPLRPLQAGELATVFRLDDRERFNICITRGRWLTRMATWRYDPRARLNRAAAFFNQALSLDSSRIEPYLGLTMVSSLQRKPQEAQLHLARATALDEQMVRRYFDHSWTRQVLEYGRKTASSLTRNRDENSWPSCN